LPSSMSLEISLALLPHIGLVDPIEVLAFAGKGKLAGEMPTGVLVDDATDVVRVNPGENTRFITHLRNGLLAFERLAARLEIDRIGETFLGPRARLAFEPELLRGT